MSQAVQVAGKVSIVAKMAERFGMEAGPFQATMMATVMPSNAKPEHLAAFLVVADQYNLNVFTKEIYAFPTKSGGVQPLVSVDGWATLVNSHPQCDGFELLEVFSDDGEQLVAVEARMHRKDRQHPVVLREYLVECFRETEPWKRWPRRMLRHKAFVQCARLAFGFSGIADEDEFERSVDVQATVAHRPQPSVKSVASASFMSAAKPETPRDPPGGSSLPDTMAGELFETSRKDDPA